MDNLICHCLDVSQPPTDVAIPVFPTDDDDRRRQCRAAAHPNTWHFPSSDSISGDGKRKSANRIKRELSHDGWVEADEELFFLVDCETLFIANAQDIPVQKACAR